MDTLFSQVGVRPWDFLQVSTIFLLTMVMFFGIKEKRYLWLNYFMLVIFGLQSLFFILFHEGLQIKLFAALMLMSTLTIEVVLSKRRKLHGLK